MVSLTVISVVDGSIFWQKIISLENQSQIKAQVEKENVLILSDPVCSRGHFYELLWAQSASLH